MFVDWKGGDVRRAIKSVLNMLKSVNKAITNMHIVYILDSCTEWLVGKFPWIWTNEFTSFVFARNSLNLRLLYQLTDLAHSNEILHTNTVIFHQLSSRHQTKMWQVCASKCNFQSQSRQIRCVLKCATIERVLEFSVCSRTTHTHTSTWKYVDAQNASLEWTQKRGIRIHGTRLTAFGFRNLNPIWL